MGSPVPENEESRLAALRSYGLLDSPPEEGFDRIVAVASEICNTPIALFSLVDEDRQWFKARVGLDAMQTPRDLAFCAHAVAADEELLVNDAEQDPRFVDNALVLGAPHIRFYYGVPIHASTGEALGTLCVIDRTPRQLTETQRLAMGQLSRELEIRLELRRTSADLAQALDDRAVMSAMVAHDARNLLTRIVGEIDLAMLSADQETSESLERALDSTGRLLRMCESFVELNRGLERPTIAVSPMPCDLRHWIEELVQRENNRARGEGVELILDTHLDPPTRSTDVALLERVILNLLDNAYREAPPDSAVVIRLSGNSKGGFELSVEDRGRGVAEKDRERLFEPYYRAKHSKAGGAGLGLAFCRLAASALGGCIDYEPRDVGGARFTVRIPEA